MYIVQKFHRGYVCATAKTKEKYLSKVLIINNFYQK